MQWNGSSRPPPAPPSTLDSNTTTDGDSSSSSKPARTFPLSARRPSTSATNLPNGNMKGKIFGSAPASPTVARPKSGYQSVRGRISGPIPIPNPLDDDEFPIRNPGTGIASSTPIENDLIVQRQLSLPQVMPQASNSPVTPSFAPPPPPTVAQTLPAAGRGEILDVPQTVPEHPGTPTKPPGSAATAPSWTRSSPEGAVSSVSGAQSSTKLQHQRANPSASVRYSTVSAGSGKTGSTGDAGPPQRKKSTLRSAIGRLLRRKKKEGRLSSVSESDRQIAVPRQQPQHRSVSLLAARVATGPVLAVGWLADDRVNQVPPAIRTQPLPDLQQQKRVTSMPISEFDRALRSHSIGPDDINAIESARNSIDALGSAQFRQRATAAVQGKLYSGLVPRSRGEEWAGLSPRPASTHGRGSRLEDDPDAIGRAITSDGNGDVGHKRRSRSLSQLTEIIAQGGGRRRSDEIRYWRQSYDINPGPTSPLSSGPDEDRTDVNDARRPSITAVEYSAERVPKTPPQPFNFGTVASMSEMAGMKITQAVTLEERFTYLEVRMNKVERVVNQLCHSVPGFKGPFMEVPAPARMSSTSSGRGRSGSVSAAAGMHTHNVMVSQPAYAYSTARPPMIPSIYQAEPMGIGASSQTADSRRSMDTSTDDNASSHVSIGGGATYMDSLHPPSSSATQAVSTAATSVPGAPGLLRPTSEITVRPAASMPSLGSQSSNGGEERSSNTAILIAQLDSERAARQLLEDQVRKLSERMNNLSTTMFAMVRDPARSKSSERTRPQTAGSTVAPTPSNSTPLPAPSAVFVNTSSRAIAPSSKAQSIFGKESAGLGSIASSPSKEVGEDEYSEAFQTPMEGPTPRVGSPPAAFGDEFGAAVGPEDVGDVDDDEERRKAARVLSLSQLTMGTDPTTRI